LNDLMSSCNKPSSVLTKDLFELAFRIRRFNDIISSHSEIQSLELSGFEGLVIRWIEQSKSKLLEWSGEAVKRDNWEKVDGANHSTSVVDMFSALYAPVPILLDALFLQTHPNSFLLAFSKLVEDVVSQYSTELESIALSELPTEMKQPFELFLSKFGTSSSSRISNPQKFSAKNVITSTKDLIFNKIRSISKSSQSAQSNQSPPISTSPVSKYSSTTSTTNTPKPSNTGSPTTPSKRISSAKLSPHVSRKLCLMINNIEVARLKLVEVEDELGNDMSDLLNNSFEMLKTTKVTLQALAIFKMNDPISRYLKQIVVDEKAQIPSKNEVDKYTSQLIDYLDQQLTTMSDSLLPSLFTKTIKLLWQTILNVSFLVLFCLFFF
jgi:hypothetical protein